MATRFGVLLPHFGYTATKERVIDSAPQLEEWGLDSVWVRDHLMFQPHEFERQSTKFFEPFSTLTAIAAITKRLVVGTAVIVPFRHPLVVSQLLGGVSLVAGPERLIVGVGAGTPKKAFDATGLSYDDRFRLVRELAEVLRLTWSGEKVSYHGKIHSFDGITIDPHPPADTPIWYGGATTPSIRRALRYCDGWMPGRCVFSEFDKLVEELRAKGEAQNRRMGVGIIPVVSIDRTREEALAKINVEGLLEEARHRKDWTGPFNTADDLAGMLIAGSPEECIEQVRAYIERGVDQLVFDFRMRPDEYDSQIRWLARDILPAARELASAAGAR